MAHNSDQDKVTEALLRYMYHEERMREIQKLHDAWIEDAVERLVVDVADLDDFSENNFVEIISLILKKQSKVKDKVKSILIPVKIFLHCLHPNKVAF